MDCLTVATTNFNFIIDIYSKTSIHIDGITIKLIQIGFISYNPSTHPINVYWSDKISSEKVLKLNDN